MGVAIYLDKEIVQVFHEDETSNFSKLIEWLESSSDVPFTVRISVQGRDDIILYKHSIKYVRKTTQE